MAVYRFRVSFEDYDDVVREIDIKSNQTFKDLHYAIHQSVGYDPEKSSSFYVSNDHWIKNEEIAYLPTQRKTDRSISLMENSKLSSFIDDPHQKFYYTYNFDKPYDFHVELIKILENDPSKTFPSVFKSVGEAPRIIKPIIGSIEDITGDEDPDFIDEDETILIADEDELDSLNTDTEEAEEEEETDEFSDEFSDNENFEADDYQRD